MEEGIKKLKNLQRPVESGATGNNQAPTNRNPKSEIRNPKSEIRNPKSEIRNPKSEIRNPKSEIRNPKSEIIHCPICSGVRMIKDGHNSDRNQRYQCKDCGKTFTEKKCSHRKRNQLKSISRKLLNEGMSKLYIAKELDVSYRTILLWLNGK